MNWSQPSLSKWILTSTLSIASSVVTAQTDTASSDDQDVAELSTISVSGSQQDGPKITADKLLKVPGAGNDPLKAIEALPGVVMGGFGPFSIPAIRGSSPQDNLYITDFVPVGYVFHNDGGSTYNDNLVEDFQLRAGAWGPEYSNALGAIIETRLRDPYNEGLRTTVDLSFLRAGVLVESSVTEDQAFYLSYRESLLQFYVENFVDEDELSFTEVPKNNDYQFKYHWRVNDTMNARLIATGARDEVGIEFGKDSDFLATEPALEGGLGANTFYDNQAFIIDKLYSGGTSQELAVSHKTEDVSFAVGSLIDLDAVNEEWRLKSYFTTPLGNGDNIRYGFDIDTTAIEYTAVGKDTPCNEDLQVCPPASLGTDIVDEDKLTISSQRILAAYDWMATPHWELSPGFTAGTNDFTEEDTFQLRFNSRLRLDDELTLTAAVGQHAQFPRNFRYIAKEYGNPDLIMPNAEHYVLGVEYELGRDYSAKIEMYYKDIHDLIVANAEYDEITNPNAPKYLNEASGEAYGLEFLLNKNLTNKLYGWFSVSYSKTKRTNEQTGEDFNYSYDRPWVINLVTSYKSSDKVTYGWKWKYQSGSLFTPVESAQPLYLCSDGTVVDQDGTNLINNPALCPTDPANAYIYQPTYKGQNSERLPDYHRLDFRIDYAAAPQRDYYFEIINVYNRLNVSGYSYNKDYSEREEITSLPTIFSVGVKMTF